MTVFTPVPAINAGDIWTAADGQLWIADNFSETAPGLATAVGQWFPASGLNALRAVTPRLFIPAAKFDVVEGTAAFVAVGPTGRKVNAIALDPATIERAAMLCQYYYDPSASLKVYFWFLPGDLSGGDAVLFAALGMISPADDIDWAATEVNQAVTLAVSSASLNWLHRGLIGTFTFGAAGDMLRLTVGRVADDAGDTHTGDINLVGVELVEA